MLQTCIKMEYTANGAPTCSKANNDGWNGRISMFFHLCRNTTDEQLFEILRCSLSENLSDTLVLLYHLRDCRGGKGERELFRKSFNCLCFNTRERKELLALIPTYGRWDDVIYISRVDEYDYLWEQLLQDQKNMRDGKTTSLLAKWMPTEGFSTKTFVKLFTVRCKINPKQYRQMLSSIREYIGIVEGIISSGKWQDVKYEKVPSIAMKNLKSAFLKHDGDRFKTYIQNVKIGKETINAVQLYPYQLASSCMGPVEILQWNAVVNKFGKVTNSWIPVCDVSGSMNEKVNDSVTALHICISMGLFLSQINKGVFANRVITFSECPKWVVLDPESSTSYQYQNIQNSAWSANTNVLKVFDLILEMAILNKIKFEDIPGLVIFSDMQFDRADVSQRTNVQVAHQRFTSAGYPGLPKVVFWNLTGDTIDFPSNADNSIALVSGFSPSIIKTFMIAKELSAVGIIKCVLESNRYNVVKHVFDIDS
jgi:hypothetical protein